MAARRWLLFWASITLRRVVRALAKREPSPVLIYYLLSAGYTFCLQVVVSVNLVFQTREAQLDPLQLVLAGTVMEMSVFAFEVPTGLVADVYGRKRSVLAGFVLLGSGIMLSGAFARFETILAGSALWGFGFTFISGARQAWIADEIGVDAAGPVFLRSSQISQFARLAAIPLSIGVATQDLNLPILIGGALFIAMALFLSFAMPERGFIAPATRLRFTPSQLTGKLFEGSRLVRTSPLLLTIFLIMAFFGMASEGFDRLWVAHFDRDLGFPGLGSLQPVVWFGVLRMGAALASIGAVEVVRRRVDTTSHSIVARTLLLINALQAASLATFAFAGGFEVGMAAFWLTIAISAMEEPLRLAWLNQNIEPQVRATVLSMSSQTDAVGQMAGGPVLGLIGKVESIRAALVGAAVCLLPAMPLYVRALRQGKSPGELNQGEASAGC